MVVLPSHACVTHDSPLVHSALPAQTCAPLPASAPGHPPPAVTGWHVVAAVNPNRLAQQTWPDGQAQACAQATTTLSGGGWVGHPARAVPLVGFMRHA